MLQSTLGVKAKHSSELKCAMCQHVEGICGYVAPSALVSSLPCLYFPSLCSTPSVTFVLGEVNFVVRKSVAELRLLSLQFALSALEHRVYEVRETAVKIILDMYRQHPALTLEHLPPEDSSTRKNLLYKAIFEGFAKIDGRPTEAEVRVSWCS